MKMDTRSPARGRESDEAPAVDSAGKEHRLGEEESAGNRLTSHNGTGRNSLVTSFTPMDDNFIKAAERKQDNSIMFIDTAGNNGPVVVTSGSGECNVICKPDQPNKEDTDSSGLEYRGESDSSSSGSDLSVYNSFSDNENEIEEVFSKGPHVKNVSETANPGELLLKDLPPIEDLRISVPEIECQKVGTVSWVINELVVIQAMPNIPALDLGTVLFMKSGKEALGKIFDVFGKVKEPYYAVRFNSEEHALKRGVTRGMEVFCAPRTEYTSYVFLHEMIKMKGSDASWENNHEPPAHCLDYSDDEEERSSRRRKQAQNRRREWQYNEDSEDSEEIEVIGDHSLSNHGNRPTGSEVDGNQRSHTAEFNNRNSVHHGSVGPVSTGCVTHSMQSHPRNRQFVRANSDNRPSNRININSAPPLHPPGHPPVLNGYPDTTGVCDSVLKAAKRVNLHLFRNHPCYEQVLNGTYPLPKPRAPGEISHRIRSVPLWLIHLRNSQREAAERESQQRPPLLPSPTSNPLVGLDPVQPLRQSPVSTFGLPPSNVLSPSLNPNRGLGMETQGPLPHAMPYSFRHLNGQPIPRPATQCNGQPIPTPAAQFNGQPILRPATQYNGQPIPTPAAQFNGQPIPRPESQFNLPDHPGPSFGDRLCSPPAFLPSYQFSGNIGNSYNGMNCLPPCPPPSSQSPSMRPFLLSPSHFNQNSSKNLPKR